MNKRWLVIVWMPLLAFGCKGASKDLSGNSSSLIFSNSWRTSKVLADAETLYLFEGNSRGFSGVKELKKGSRLLGKFEGADVRNGIAIMRQIISRSGASSKGMHPKYQIILTGKGDIPLAYWEILSSQESESGSNDFIVVFPTGGVFNISEVYDFVHAAQLNRSKRER